MNFSKEEYEDLISDVRLLKNLNITYSYHIQLLQQRIINLESFMKASEHIFEKNNMKR